MPKSYDSFNSHSSFSTTMQPEELRADKAREYPSEFAQFNGEWEEAPRELRRERGAKAANAAGISFSSGESIVDNHPHPATETGDSSESSDDTATAPQASRPFANIDNFDVDESASIASNRTKSGIPEPYIPEQPRSFSQMDAHRQALIDELFPPDAHNAPVASDSTNDASGARVGKHFADETSSKYEKRWAREHNRAGRRFADGPTPKTESRWQREPDDLDGKHYAEGSRGQRGRYAEDGPDAKGTRFRKEEKKNKGGRHFAEEPKGRRWAREPEGEPGKHFRVEQEKNANLLRSILDKVKKSKGFKAVVSVALAAVIAFSATGGFFHNQASAMGADDFESSVQADVGDFESAVQAAAGEESGGSGETERQHNVLTGYEALDELIDGSFEQDDNPGCYEADGKVSDNAVGNPNEVLELMNIDPANATAEDYGKVSEYMAYSMKYPAAYIAVANGFEGFEGLTTNQAEQKIASMTDAEKQNFQGELKYTFDHTTYNLKSANGAYRDYGVTGEGTGRHSYFVDTNFNNTMLLEAQTVDFNGDVTITYSKADCDNPVDFIVQYNSTTNNYEAQLISTTEEDTDNPGESETPEDSEDSDDSDDDPTPPEENIKPKDGDRLQRIDQDILNQVADEIRTGEVRVNQNPGVSESERTDAPADDVYEGTNATIVQNDTSQNATSTQGDVSYGNNYTESRGGVNMGEYSPVQGNPYADTEANNRGDTASDATGGDIGNALAGDGVDLG